MKIETAEETAPNKRFMQLALQLAAEAAAAGEVPVGAVLVKSGAIVAQANNRVERDQDPTAHAEILAIQQASKLLGEKRLLGCDLYVSLEPCTMCAGALALARVQRVVFAATDQKGGGILHGAKFFEQPTCHHRPDIVHMHEFEEPAGQMLKDFFRARR